MALINCRVCGKEVSNKAVMCPKCKSSVIPPVKPIIQTTHCGECKKEIYASAATCPNCGAPVKKKSELTRELSRNESIVLIIIAIAVVTGMIWIAYNDAGPKVAGYVVLALMILSLTGALAKAFGTKWEKLDYESMDTPTKAFWVIGYILEKMFFVLVAFLIIAFVFLFAVMKPLLKKRR
ncbi:MAG: zinc ribbon domain-containing protein [Azonexus sp.]|jgi:RNA polymerase subunit RPABC4/transcription elongation factor Spt4|nr:zinc ribbon domain-containing protein [Azonexus sp.]